MKIKRNVVVPIMLALFFISLLIAALTFLAADSEFHQFDHVGVQMPAFAGVFRSVYGVAWLLPAIAGGLSIWLFRHPECSAVLLAWSATVVTVIVFAWSAFAFVALYTLHVASNYYL